MNLKKITNALTKVRDNIDDHGGEMTEADEDLLYELLKDTIDFAQDDLKALPKNIEPFLPIPNNDNSELSSEQKYRLRLIEKTGTGSASIH